MKTKLIVLLHVALLLTFNAIEATAQTAFTYQGQLKETGNPANGAYDLLFSLYDDGIAGSQIGATMSKSGLALTNGVFTALLDFGASAFNGSPRWLEIRVRPGGSPGLYTALQPRQPVSPTPYAIYAFTAGSVPDGAVTAQKLATNAVSAGAIQDSAVTSPKIASGQVVKSLNSLKDNVTISAGPNITLSTNGNGLQISATGGVGSGWSLNGNSGTTAGANFLGTTDNQPLEFRVNNDRVLRIEPEAVNFNPLSTNYGINVIGGYRSNKVENGSVGVTICGGGARIFGQSGQTWVGTNSVIGDYGAVVGGFANRAGDTAFVGGGCWNQATNMLATVSGGWANVAGGFQATVSGGFWNKATGRSATVSGGEQSSAEGDYSTVGGGRYNIASGNYATVSGGNQNVATNDYSTVSGGNSNTNAGSYATIGGGSGNVVSGNHSTISGGGNNTIQTNSYSSVIAGGGNNTIQSDSHEAFIGGGYLNIIQGHANHSIIGGGALNVLEANANESIIVGGLINVIQSNANSAVIAGGNHNTIQTSANSSFIGGGSDNSIQTNAQFAVIPGGTGNTAGGSFSLAAGCRAKANHSGAFVWGDSTAADIASTTNNQFTVRASGGARFFSNAAASSGVSLGAGAGAWSSLSDRNAKENLAPVNGREILERLSAVPLQTWNYRSQAVSIRHIGPMAQDFATAFGVGEDEKHISTVDADGVALAAIQGLHQLVKEKESKIEALEKRLANLEELVTSLSRQQAGGGQ